jgi:hypothetical protein
VGGNLLPEEHGGELADVGSFGRAEVVDERGHHLRVARQPPDLLLRLPPRVVVRHQKLDQQQLQRLRHSSRLIQPLPAGPSLFYCDQAAAGAKTLSIWRRRRSGFGSGARGCGAGGVISSNLRNCYHFRCHINFLKIGTVGQMGLEKYGRLMCF